MEDSQENEQLKEKIMLPKPIQQKISSTRILLINLNSCITEIAKIFINKGFNIYLYDTEKVSQKDVNNNFIPTADSSAHPAGFRDFTIL